MTSSRPGRGGRRAGRTGRRTSLRAHRSGRRRSPRGTPARTTRPAARGRGTAAALPGTPRRRPAATPATSELDGDRHDPDQQRAVRLTDVAMPHGTTRLTTRPSSAVSRSQDPSSSQARSRPSSPAPSPRGPSSARGGSRGCPPAAARSRPGPRSPGRPRPAGSTGDTTAAGSSARAATICRQGRGAHRDRQRVDRHAARSARPVRRSSCAGSNPSRRTRCPPSSPSSASATVPSSSTDTTTNRSSGTRVRVRVPTSGTSAQTTQAGRPSAPAARSTDTRLAAPGRAQRLLGQQLADVAPRLRHPGADAALHPGAGLPHHADQQRASSATTTTTWTTATSDRGLPRRSQRSPRTQHDAPGRRTRSPR